MLRSSRMIVSKNSSVSFCIAARSDSSKAGNIAGSGVTVLRLRICSHWPAKFSTRARDFGILEHPPDLGLEHVGLTQLALAGVVEQLVVGHAAPEEVRQPRGQLPVVDGVRRASLGRLVDLDAEEEVRRREHRLQGELNARLEGVAVLVGRIDEAEEAADLVVG